MRAGLPRNCLMSSGRNESSSEDAKSSDMIKDQSVTRYAEVYAFETTMWEVHAT
jgi:hypothetical protein